MRSAQFTRGRGSGRRCCEPEAGDRRLTLQGDGARCRESYRDSVCLLTGSRAQWNRNRVVPQFEKKPFVPLPVLVHLGISCRFLPIPRGATSKCFTF